MLSVDMGVDIHLCFLFGGDLGVYSISIYIYSYIHHVLYSIFCMIQPSTAVFVPD